MRIGGMDMRLKSVRPGAAAVPPSTLLDGLVSYWTLDEESGTRVDSVGDNDLSDNNTTGYDTGVNGNAAKFVRGDSENLSKASFTAPDSYTVSGWVKGTAADNGGEGIIGVIGAWPNSVQFTIYFASNNTVSHLVGDGSDYKAAVAIAYDSEEWNFFCAWFSAADKTPHIQINDGPVDDLVPGVALSGTPYRTAATLKISLDGGPAFLTGLADEVALHNRVLTADEIVERYNSGAGKFYPF